MKELVWLLLFSVMCPGFFLPAQAAPLGDSLCLGVKFSQGQPQSQLPMLQDLGVRWVRDGVAWPLVEPQAGKFVEFPVAFRERLAYYKAHDIGVVFLLTYGNEQAYPGLFGPSVESVDAQAYARYAAHVARLMKASGVRFVLEIWNEPHNFVLPKFFGGNWQGKSPSPWLDHYVSMVRAAFAAVKAVDPAIKVLTDDDMWIVHYWFLEAGLPPGIDGFAIHPYAALPELTAVAHDTDWTRPFQVVDADRSFGSAVRRLREQAQKKLGRVPEIWITEWGWEAGGKAPGGGVFSEEQIAAYLVRSYVTAAAARIPVTCWFSAQDSVDGPMGLTDNSGHKRKAYGAFKELSEELGEFQLVRQVIGAEMPTRGPQAFLFRHPESGELRGVAWSIGEPATLAVSAGSLGRIQVQLGEKPVYLHALQPGNEWSLENRH